MQKQMTSSVRWVQLIEQQWASDVRQWIEVGPKEILAKLLKPNLKDCAETWTSQNINNLEKAESFSVEA